MDQCQEKKNKMIDQTKSRKKKQQLRKRNQNRKVKDVLLPLENHRKLSLKVRQSMRTIGNQGVQLVGEKSKDRQMKES